MKILHCNTHDHGGGAAIAARRIHEGLLELKIDSNFGTFHRADDDPTVIALSNSWRRMFNPIFARLEKLPLQFGMIAKGLPFSLNLMPSLVHRRINALRADIVHLHWIAGGFIPLFSLARIKKPVMWTLHDNWAFTGGCHILQNCGHYKTYCDDCPQLRKQAHCFVKRNFNVKRKIYTSIRPIIVTPSKALQNKVMQSALLNNSICRHIPNCINAKIFAPIEKETARHILQIPQTTKIIAFGAVAATSDPNKGFDLLIDALQALKEFYLHPVRLLVFGASKLPDLQSTYPVLCLGQLHDDVSLRLAYSAADVFVCPSREENLPNTIMESLACGTPVAAFSVGGIPDMVEHDVNGCLAKPHDSRELARCIAYIIENDDRKARMGDAARQTVEARYTQPIVAAQYKNLYENILENLHNHKSDRLL